MLVNEGITSNLVHYGSISPRFSSVRASERWYSPPSPVNWGWGMETEWLDYSCLLSWKEKGWSSFPKTYGFFPRLPSKHKWTQFADRWNFQTKFKLLASVWNGPEGLQTVSLRKHYRVQCWKSVIKTKPLLPERYHERPVQGHPLKQGEWLERWGVSRSRQAKVKIANSQEIRKSET